MPIQYVIGDATSPQGKGPKIVAHVVNDVGKWGRGFVMAVSAKWPKTREAYLEWRRQVGFSFSLGNVQMINVAQHMYVCNMLAQHGLRAGSHGPPIRYDALGSCLNELAANAQQLKASVHMPRIGCGIGKGKWEKVEPLINGALVARGISVTVYDLS